MANQNKVEPKVGMGCTLCFFTDRHAGTIVAVSDSGKRITVQRDIATRTDKNGMSDCQTYEYTPDENAEKIVFSKRKNGRWVQVGQGANHTPYLRIGGRDHYHDFSF